MGDSKVRLIEDLELLNVALTGTPVNQGAVMTGHNMKAIMLKAIADTKEEKVLVTKKLLTKLMEEKSMEETEKEVTAPVEAETPVEAPVEPVVKDEAVEATPEPAAEPEAVAEVVEETVEEKALAKVVEELKAKVEAQASELKTLKESPVFKSTVSEQPVVEAKSVDMLSLIR